MTHGRGTADQPAADGPAADRPGLPRLLVLTDRGQSEAAGRTLPETVAAAVRGGARAVVLREKDLPAPARLDLARALRALLDPAGGVLIVASDACVARTVHADGVHLARDESPARTVPSAGGGRRGAAGRPDRSPAGGAGPLLGRSCHDAVELRAAAALGVDYVTLSPIYATPSKPGYGPALGEAMPGLIADTPGCPPVYALGGITPERVAECRTAGAYGVAVMGAVMGAADPAAVAAGFVRALR